MKLNAKTNQVHGLPRVVYMFNEEHGWRHGCRGAKAHLGVRLNTHEHTTLFSHCEPIHLDEPPF
jgi:hypothetical protein